VLQERLTQEDVGRLLGTVLTFYRSNRDPNDFAKSDNRIYLHPRQRQEHQRNDGLLRAGHKIQALQDFLYEKKREWSDLERGQYIVENKISYGNCTEMSLAATYLCAIDENFARKAQHTWLVLTTRHPDDLTVDSASDHTFVLISDNQDVSRRRLTMNLLNNAPAEAGLWIIDPWLKIACSARDYSNHINQKLEKWETIGKAIGSSMGEHGTVVPPEDSLSETYTALKSSRLHLRKLAPPPLQHAFENTLRGTSQDLRQPSQGRKLH